MTEESTKPAAPATSGSRADPKSMLAIVVTALAFLGFIAAVVFLLSVARSSSDQEWQRLVYVFGGIEAVVFTAVGWLFGREVNRRQAEGAEQRADESDKVAKAAITRAADLDARGQAAKAAVQSRLVTYSDPGKARSRGIGADSAGAASSEIGELADFMNALFPD